MPARCSRRMFFFGSISVQNAADAYLNTLLYRHALGLPLPDDHAYDLTRQPGGTGPALSGPGLPGV